MAIDRFLDWLSRENAKAVAARRLNDNPSILEIIQSVEGHSPLPRPKDPAQYVDYILYYGNLAEIEQLQPQFCIALDSVVGPKKDSRGELSLNERRPSYELTRDIFPFATGTDRQREGFARVVLASRIIKLNPKALQRLTRDVRDALQYVLLDAEMDRNPADKNLLRSYAKYTTPRPSVHVA